MRRILRGGMWCAIVIATVGYSSVVSAATGDAFRSSGRLFGGGLHGQARYAEQMRNGRLLRLFVLDIENADPFQNIPIFVNGQRLLTMTTNPAGKGRLIMRSAEFFDDPTAGMKMPAGFPRLRTGDFVAAGPATGVIFTRHGGNVLPTPDRVQTVATHGRVQGTGPSGVKGTVEFRARQVRGQPVERIFTADLSNIPPFESVQIKLDHQVIATATADGDGNANLVLRTQSYIDEAGEIAMPTSFPSLHAGNVLRIDGVRVTLVRGGLVQDDDD